MTDDQQQSATPDPDEDAEDSRAGGDAAAAGTVGEREAVARGDDDLFGGDADDADADEEATDPNGQASAP